MRRLTTALIAILLVVSTVAAVPAAGVQSVTNADTVQEDETDSTETDDNGTVAPGERLAGVVGVQEAELDGEMEARTFGLSVARAASDDAKAALVAAKVNETGENLAELREQRDELREARENGSISEGEYRARMAELGARTKNVERMANETENATRGLPEETLRANGVNATAIQTLREQARELSGQEVAEIARSIAGDVGRDLGERPEQARGQAGDATDRGGPETPGGDAPTDDDAANSTDANAPTDRPSTEQTADGAEGSGTPNGTDGPSAGGNAGSPSADANH